MEQKEREGGQQGEHWQRQEMIATIAMIAAIATISMMTERKKKLKQSYLIKIILLTMKILCCGILIFCS